MDLSIDILNKNSGHNSATSDKFPRSVLPGTFDYGFSLGLSYKDMNLCIQEAQAMKIPMAVGSLVFQMLSIANAVYGPSADFTNVCRLEETWSGMEIRSRTIAAPR